MGDFTISKELQEALRKSNIEPLAIKIATPEEFHNAIGAVKKDHDFGAFVEQHTLEEYAKMRLFITDDGKAGLAITPDNNIVSVFNGGKRKSVLRTLLPVAIEQGGRKLDNFNSGKLSTMYQMHGFNPISQVKFNSNFAPDDWNYERDGEPNIIFWIHNGDAAEDVVINFGRYLVPWDAVQEFSTYEEAEEYRDRLIEEIDRMEEEAAPCV